MVHRLSQFALAAAGIVALLLFVQYAPLPKYTVLWDRLFDTGHILVFGLAAVFALTMLRAVGEGRYLAAQYAIAIVAMSVLGLALEIYQGSHGRDAEWIDLANDVIGIVSFAALFAALDRRIENPRAFLLQRSRLTAFAMLLLLLGCIPVLNTLDLYLTRRQIFPRLIDFSEPWRDKFYYVRSADLTLEPVPDQWPDSDDRPVRAARLRLHKDTPYPGIVILEPYPDWRDFNYLEVEVFYPTTDAATLVLRIHDLAHDYEVTDRFRFKHQLVSGFQTIRIPLRAVRDAPESRQMVMSRIDGVALFAVRPPRDVVLFLGAIRLVH